jgi:trk system potassium uptake protein TrkH
LRGKAVMATLGYLLMLFSLTFFIPIITGVIYDEPAALLYSSYVLPMLASACLGGIMWYHTRHKAEELREREAFVAVGLGWALMALIGSLPYMFSGSIINPLDAYFESMSGFTTTGATVLNVGPGQDFLDVYPHSILMWRSLTCWLGGMGFIVFSVVILSKFLEGSVHLFKTEISGATVTRIRPKLVETARILWGIYSLLTLISFLLLMGAGLGAFDAINVSFSTLATGGFSVHAGNIGAYNSFVVELIVMLFMIIGGVNFVLHYKLMTGRIRDVFKDTELRFFIGVIAVFSSLTLLAMLLSGHFGSSALDIRHGLFQMISASTTGGFTTSSDLSSWPPMVHMLLILAMMFGASIGSTGGGIKAARLLLLLKNTRRMIFKAIHPRAMKPIKVGGRPVKESVIEKVQIMFFAYLVVFAVASVIICATGLSVLESISSVAGSLGNAGLGIFSPGNGFYNISGLAKAVLIFCMWMGRLEIFTALIVLAPSTYRD